MPTLVEKVDALAARVARHTAHEGEHSTFIEALKLYRSTRPTKPTAALYDPSVCLVLQGRKRAIVGQDVYRYDPANFLVVTAGLPMIGEITHASRREPYLCARVMLDLALAAEVLASLPPGRIAASTRVAAVRPIDEALLDAVDRLVGLLDEPAHAPVLAPLVLREITYRLLIGDEGAQLRQVIAGDGHARRIALSLAWLRAHYTEPLRVEAMAQRAGMSPSTFHQHFKRVTGMSPLQYQKHLRLHEARRLLLAERLDATEACFRVGYESASQFSREYARLFGAPPRRDVSALIASAQPLAI